MTTDLFRAKYGYEIDGCWMPRVTAITSVASTLRAFFGEEEARSPWVSSELEQYASWGTLVHGTIQRILKGEVFDVDPRIAPSVEAFLQWRAAHSMRLEDPDADIEKRVHDKRYAYAGTIDLVARVDGVMGVIDLKTSSVIREEYALQTAAYLHAHNTQISTDLFGQGNEMLCKKRWIVRVDQYQECEGCLARKRMKGSRARIQGGKKTCNHQWRNLRGEVEWKELECQREDFEAFLAAKHLWEWQHKDHLKNIKNYPRNFSL